MKTADHNTIAKRSAPVSEMSTFWLLFGTFGPTMQLEDLRATFFPHATLKTMRNRATMGGLPPRAGQVFDTRDVADWWDLQRPT